MATQQAIEQFSGQFRFLSNFHPCTVYLDATAYPSVEHAYQAAKTSILPLRVPFQSFRMTAGQAKRQGRKLPIRSDWEQIKVAMMKTLVMSKFENSSELRRLLLATGLQPLVEGNHWNDYFWGKCYGVGENHLGKILMEVRAACHHLT